MSNSSTIFTRLRNRCRKALSTACGRRVVHLRPRFPMVSFSFDDFPRSAWQQGGKILERHGVRGTYYTSLGLMNQKIPAGLGFSVEDLRELVAAGHELGCHTFAHLHAWETRPVAFEESIVENQRALAKILPAAVFKTLSYPIDCPRPQTKQRAARHFACCRGGGQNFNVGATDLNNLQAFFLEKSRDNPDAIKRLVDENRRARGWLIFATHDVCASPSAYGCAPEFFENIVGCALDSGAKILPVGEAWDVLKANHFASV